MTKTLYNARVITPEEIFKGGLIIEGDRIERVFRENELTPAGEAYDCKGQYLSPGFVDIHVHSCFDGSFQSGDPESVNRVTNYFAKHGTTSILATTASGSASDILKAVKCIADVMKTGNDGARLLGAHLEGCYLNPKCAGAQNPEYLFAPKPENYMPIIETGIVRRVSASPEVEGVLDMARILAPQGVLMSVAHSDADYAVMMQAVEAGFSHVTHIYNAISMLSNCYYYPQVGACETALLHDEFTVEAICDGRHVPPQLLRLMYKVKGPERFHAVTDSAYAGAPDGPCELFGMKCLVDDDVCMLADRSAFAGSVATTERLLRTLVFDAQIPLCDAVKMLTLTPAKQIGEQEIGRLSKDMFADINMFDDSLTVKRTWIGGEVFR